MRFALDSENRRIHATAANKTQEYFCPICHGRVTPRQGEINVWHFAHQSSCTDVWSYDMSEWHRSWQERFPEEQREVVVKHNGKSHRADILIGNYVIEFQHSKISAGEFEERNAFYTSAGNKVIWVFDEVEARQTERIDDGDDSNEYIWRWPNRSISSVIPQESKNVAIIFQFAEADDEIEDPWLVKIEKAVLRYGLYGKFANYGWFFCDEEFAPDLFSEEGLQEIFLNKQQRFEAFLNKHRPFQLKSWKTSDSPINWRRCPKTEQWHNGACYRCPHNLINEHRKTGYQRYEVFCYCCYPRVINKPTESGHCYVDETCT